MEERWRLERRMDMGKGKRVGWRVGHEGINLVRYLGGEMFVLSNNKGGRNQEKK